ncbi:MULTISPECIES: alpha/beta hydrolase [unclassified Tolypothrix]|uniref:alpha/beta hydrolase n=1 Tax=unclassified Tolypothrix TaxID=2649714 RepID=UPI0005EABE85|nr:MULTISPECIES: alpha/beta hydrolase [unclassified Tolypothrix]BAY93078.1 alpha/beta hydrolase fold protein [Microchaete diplosiphon NIES-3275]EKF00324.1 hydrolase, alpha/beta fold family protein [Tolypothrix sp. PCC 7601]MBE9085921.1 alpha/beta hydrolase [Tolypothrix sp. LEGE 11397]UYD26959.1 alpha/beta hydrolase [Tolypothrix sp. PCC 7712]UYD37182.1 lysophospholipase [Tolypothrix sp. PCC 7601]
MVYHSEDTFKGLGELDLYYQSWFPEGQLKGILVIVHGLGAHSSRFGNIIDQLIPQQYAIYAFDMRGNGSSPGQRGHINSWAEFREDLRVFIKLIEIQQPGFPLFIMGQSLGAVVVLDYILHYPNEVSTLKGAIALAPALGVGVSKFRLLLGQLLSRIWPQFSLSTGLDLSSASRDQKILAAYAQDPLRHTLGTARLATEYLATVDWIYTHAPEWQLPLLILHGEADKVALPEGGERFYDLVSAKDKLRIVYPGAYHELHNDINYKEVVADLQNWLDCHGD